MFNIHHEFPIIYHLFYFDGFPKLKASKARPDCDTSNISSYK